MPGSSSIKTKPKQLQKEKPQKNKTLPQKKRKFYRLNQFNQFLNPPEFYKCGNFTL